MPTPTPAATHYFTPARSTLKQEEIEDVSSDDLQGVHESIETEDHDFGAEYLSGDEEYDYIEERNSKRRRLSSSPMLLDEDVPTIKNADKQHHLPDTASSPLPIILSTPRSRPVSTPAPRFLITTPAPQPASQLLQTPFLRPPRFRALEPSEQTQSQADPLPEQFSPHRRGQKYVAGGLAAEVRDWLVNIETMVPANSVQKNRDDPWLLQLLVDDVSGGGRAGITAVSGRQVHSALGGMIDTLGIVKVILAGEGASTGLQKGSKVEVGKTVGIKGPVWEITLDGEKWGVGVDWKVLL